MDGTMIAAVGTAQANGTRIHEVDADVASRGRLELEAETAAGATRVSFAYGGRTVRGRLDDADEDDRTRDWSAFAPALAADRQGGHRVSVRVRACGHSGCTTVTVAYPSASNWTSLPGRVPARSCSIVIRTKSAPDSATATTRSLP